MLARAVKYNKYSTPIKFWWAFARPKVEHLMEDTEKRYLYEAHKDKLMTVADFSEDMHSRVHEEYVRSRGVEIAKVLEMTCLSGISGVPEIIASYLFFVEEIRLHFRLNIIDNSVMEYGEPKSDFVEAIGQVEKTLFQHYLVEFMHNLFQCQLMWLDSGGGESKKIIENILELLYGNGTSVLVTIKEAGFWSWQHVYNGGEPEHGVLYDVSDVKDKWYQAIFYKRRKPDEENGETEVKLRVHFINWQKKWDEWLGLSSLSGRIFTRGGQTKGPRVRSHPVLGNNWIGKTKFRSCAFEQWITSLDTKKKEAINEAIPALSKGRINFEDMASKLGEPVDFIRIMNANLRLQSNNSDLSAKFSGDINKLDLEIFWNRLFYSYITGVVREVSYKSPISDYWTIVSCFSG